MVRTRRRAILAVTCLGAGLVISLGAGLLINSMRAADAHELPAITVEAHFPGMPASVVEERVAFTLEAKINGVENLEQLRSRCGRDGSYSLEIAFARGIDPNLAQMLVQNRVHDAMPLLPEEVRRLGVTVRKASPVLVMLLTLSSTDKSADISSDLNNFASVYFRPQLSRVPGVAEVNLHASDGMSARILLDPQRLAAYQLTVPDVKRAIEQQALEATSGPRGGFQFTQNARGGLKLDQLASIAIKSGPNGTAIKIDDVKSVIRTGEDLVGFASLDGNSAAVLEVYATAGADPHAVSAAVRDQLPELRESLPPGLELSDEFEFTARATPAAPGHLLLDVNLRLRRPERVRPRAPCPHRPIAPRDPGSPPRAGALGRSPLIGIAANHAWSWGSLRRTGRRWTASASIVRSIRDSPPRRSRLRSGSATCPALPDRGASAIPSNSRLRGFERQPLRELANTIVAQMSRDPRLTDAWAGPRPLPAFAVDIDRAKVARLGLALPDVSSSLQAVFGSVQAGNVQVITREWPILLKIDPAGRSEVERSSRASSVPQWVI